MAVAVATWQKGQSLSSSVDLVSMCRACTAVESRTSSRQNAISHLTAVGRFARFARICLTASISGQNRSTRMIARKLSGRVESAGHGQLPQANDLKPTETAGKRAYVLRHNRSKGRALHRTMLPQVSGDWRNGIGEKICIAPPTRDLGLRPGAPDSLPKDGATALLQKSTDRVRRVALFCAAPAGAQLCFELLPTVPAPARAIARAGSSRGGLNS